MPNEIDFAGLRGRAAAASRRLYEHFIQTSRRGRHAIIADSAGSADTEMLGALKAVADALPALLDEIERLRAYQHAGDAASREQEREIETAEASVAELENERDAALAKVKELEAEDAEVEAKFQAQQREIDQFALLEAEWRSENDALKAKLVETQGERDGAILRAEAAEKERDDWYGQSKMQCWGRETAEAKLEAVREWATRDEGFPMYYPEHALEVLAIIDKETANAK